MLSLLLCLASSSSFVLKQIFRPSIDGPYLFGRCVSFASNSHRIAVGAEHESAYGVDKKGVIYVYDYVASINAWNLSAKLSAPHSSRLRIFGLGSTVKITPDGNRIFAGAPYTNDMANPNSGAVVVFDFISNQWVQSATLIPDTPNDDLGFGRSMDILSTGNEIVIGATNSVSLTTITLPGCAFVFIYKGNAWTQTQRIDHNTGIVLKGSRFASAIQITNNTQLMISTSAINGAEIGPSMYWKSGSKWISNGYVPPYQASSYEYYGGHSSMPPNNLDYVTVIGNSPTLTKAYVMEKIGGTWNLLTSFSPEDGATFGSVYMCNSHRVIMTDMSNSKKANKAGAIHVYDRKSDKFVYTESIYPPDSTPFLSFGTGISISADCNTIVVGADSQASSGTAYVTENGPRAYVYVSEESYGESSIGFKIVFWTIFVFACLVGGVCLAAYFYSQKPRGFAPINTNG